MPTLFKRSNGIYYAILSDEPGRRKWVSTGERRRNLALKKISILQPELLLQTKSSRLSEFYREFVEFARMVYSKETIATHKKSFGNLITIVGAVQLPGIAQRQTFLVHPDEMALVVLIVSSLLVGFGLSLFQFTSKLVSKWIKNNQIHNLVNGVSQRIALDVQKSKSVSVISDSSLVLEYGLGKQVIFQFNNASVWRNELQMGEVRQGQLLSHPTTDSTGSIDFRIELASIAATASVRVSPPWSSRQQFSKSLKGWNAASNRY